MGKIGLYLKITVASLLLLQAFHTVLLEDSTDSPKPTINGNWLRVKPVESKKTTSEGQTGEDQELDGAGMESSDDNMIGVEFDSMSVASGEEMDNQDGDANVTSGGVTIITTTVLPIFSNDTAEDPKMPETTVSQPMLTTVTTSQITEIGEGEESLNSTTALSDSTTHPITLNSTDSTTHPITLNSTDSTTHPITLNSTESPDFSNDTVLHETTLAPETTQEPSPGTDVNNWTIIDTEDESSTTASSTTELPSETTVDETTPESTTTMVPSATAADNITDKGSSSGSNSEKGFASDYKKNKRSKAWGAILGTAVAVALVGLVVYAILRKRNQRDFSHRKLVEEFSPDPVLRLDNSEPLDLNYGGSAYYNPGLQMDDIQMTNFPRGRNN